MEQREDMLTQQNLELLDCSDDSGEAVLLRDCSNPGVDTIITRLIFDWVKTQQVRLRGTETQFLGKEEAKLPRLSSQMALAHKKMRRESGRVFLPSLYV